MKIELNNIKIKDLAAKYENNEEEGVKGYGGQLDIRPAYQREFIYNEKQRNEVIKTIRKGFPLNIMYWAKRDDSAVPYEVLDGQQRTISICEYVDCKFSIDGLQFNNLTKEEQEQILNYELQVYICEGEAREKLDWFEIVNIAGAVLTHQELRNAIYSGSFVSDAKKFFSKTGCIAYKIAQNLMSGTCIRQDYLETALKWIAEAKSTSNDVLDIKEYMARHQHDQEATELKDYFKAVREWAYNTFEIDKHKKLTQGVNWGKLYNRFKDKKLDKNKLEKKIEKLLADDEVTNQKGVFAYVLTGDEKDLSLRTFSKNIKTRVYNKQKGKCAFCGKKFDIGEMDADHITPWSKGGTTTESNCQLLCREHNIKKSNK